jgi:hypothetical protein
MEKFQLRYAGRISAVGRLIVNALRRWWRRDPSIPDL